MPTTLITGITGQDGSYLAEFLLEKGYEVYGLVRRLSTPNETRIRAHIDDLVLLEGDLTDQSSLNVAVQTAKARRGLQPRCTIVRCHVLESTSIDR